MTTINPHFTIHYDQPEEYRFSHDSVFLARRVFEYARKAERNFERVLDLCAGCGIVGIDYLFHLQRAGLTLPSQIDFIEVQSVYEKYFARNIAKLAQINSYRFLTQNYQHISAGMKYDLILCNPPYFNFEMGKLSPSDFKNRCRFFIDSDLKNLIEFIQRSLSHEGVAFVLLKDLTQNGYAIEDELFKFDQQLKITKLEKIRTTDLFMIQSVDH